MLKKTLFAAVLLAGTSALAVSANAETAAPAKSFQLAQAVTIESNAPRERYESRTVVRRDRGLHRVERLAGREFGDERRRGRTVKKTITRNPDGSVTRSKTIRQGDDD